jgi:chaperonin GroES
MIQPIRNNVLVKCFEVSNISDGGILVPDSFKKDSNKVRIIAVGDGTKKRPMKLKSGDIAYRVRDWGTEVTDNGEKYFIMDDQAIIALQ